MHSRTDNVGYAVTAVAATLKLHITTVVLHTSSVRCVFKARGSAYIWIHSRKPPWIQRLCFGHALRFVRPGGEGSGCCRREPNPPPKLEAHFIQRLTMQETSRLNILHREKPVSWILPAH